MCAELVSFISDIVVGVSAIGVAVIAFFGLRTWRSELTGKAKFSLARDLMLTGFRMKALFEDARNPFTFSTESVDRIRKEDENPNESRVLDEWHARAKRLRPLQENLIKIIEASWETQILLDERSNNLVSEAVAVYRHNFAELTSSVSSYFEERLRGVNPNVTNIDEAWLKELRVIIYSRTDDNFSKQIEEATTKLESALQVYVK